jgi:hypothetical protein
MARRGNKALLTTLGAILALLGVYGVWHIIRAPASNAARSGVTVTADLNWDEAEVWSVKSGRVVLENHGSRPVVVREIRHTCGCMEIKALADGSWQRVKSLTIPPRGRSELSIDIQTRGVPGESVRQRIVFYTDDPAAPELAVESLVKKLTGGVTGIPSSVAFGKVIVGRPVSQEIEIVDGAVEPRCLEILESTNPGVLTIERLPCPPAPYFIRGRKVGTLIGRARLQFKAERSGLVRERALIRLAGVARAPDAVEVTADVVPLFEAVPAEVVLPRKERGADVYRVNLTVKAHTGGRVRVALARSLPPGVKLHFPGESGEAAEAQSLVVGIDAAALNPTQRPATMVVYLLVKSEEDACELQVPVTVRR